MDVFAPEVEQIMHGRTTAGCLHGDSCVAKPRTLGKLLSMVAAVKCHSAIFCVPAF